MLVDGNLSLLFCYFNKISCKCRKNKRRKINYKINFIPNGFFGDGEFLFIYFAVRGVSFDNKNPRRKLI